MKQLHSSRPVRRLAALLAATVTALALTAAPPARAEDPAPSCGEYLTRSVVLQQDLVCPSSHGLIAAASGITIDLNGHTVRGAMAEKYAGVGALAYPNWVTNITIKNGTVADFYMGAGIVGAKDVVVSGLHLANNGMGVWVEGSHRVAVRQNTFLAPQGALSFGIAFQGHGGDHRAESNGMQDMMYGVASEANVATVSIVNNTIKRAGMGGIRTASPSSTVTGNTVTGAAPPFIPGLGQLSPQSGIRVTGGGTVRNNQSGGNHLHGFDLTTSNETTVGNNLAMNNRGRGIEGAPRTGRGSNVRHGVRDLGGNRASSNTQDPQCVPVTCTA